MYLTHSLRRVAAALAFAAVPFAGHAADAAYPTKPVTIIVGYAAGGGNDVLARIIGEKLSVTLGQSVIIENRPGVASIVGASYAARAKPDGYTLFWGASGPISFNPGLYSKLPYKVDDFVPISLVGTFPLVLLVNSAVNINSVKELVDYSKQHPEKANYASSAASFQMATELFNSKTGAKFTNIPYKGSNESANAVMAGDVTMSIIDPGPAGTALQGPKVKALAVTSSQRVDFLPNVPTLKELGVDLDIELWAGLLAPAGTPPAIVKKLQDEIAKAVAMPDVQKRIIATGTVPKANTSAEFSKLIHTEVPFWTKVAKDNHITAGD